MKPYNYLFLFILLLIPFSFQEDSPPDTLELDGKNCINAVYEDCDKVIINTPGHICCQINDESAYGVIKQACELKTTKEAQNKLVGSSFIINKELGGIQIYNEKYGGVSGNITERAEQLRRDITINCYTWDLFVKLINVKDYTSKEISILKSDNHCLTYFNSYLFPTITNKRQVTKEICFNALLLPSTKNEGITCGYMEIDIEKSGSNENIKTCFLYEPKVVNIGILDESTKGNLNALTKKSEDDNINYNFTIYAKNSAIYSYDSRNEKITEINRAASNYSRMYKFIFINYIFVFVVLFL